MELFKVIQQSGWHNEIAVFCYKYGRICWQKKRTQRSATDPNPTTIPMMYVVLLEESPASGLATRFAQEVTDSSDSSGQ